MGSILVRYGLRLTHPTLHRQQRKLSTVNYQLIQDGGMD